MAVSNRLKGNVMPIVAMDTRGASYYEISLAEKRVNATRNLGLLRNLINVCRSN